MSSVKSHVRSAHSFVGMTLGGFRIMREIAAGGMASVYLGHRAGLAGFAQLSAVKIIHPHMARDRDFVEMFLDEAHIASCINHPNVCRVLDFGRAEGTYFLAMEYLLGETWSAVARALRAHEEGARLLPQILSHVLAQACEGLHGAHEAVDARGRPLHIVHRDVSPQNLFIGYDGSVRVLDFGIATAADRLHTTRHGTVKGRYSYMAPEQMLGMRVDRAADVWSLGVLLREGLTDRSVFRRATDAETILAVTREPIPAWPCQAPEALVRVADRAMQHSPGARHATAREMGAELARFNSAQREPVSMGDLSSFMQRLFAEQMRDKREMLHGATAELERLARCISLVPELCERELEVTKMDHPAPAAPSPARAAPPPEATPSAGFSIIRKVPAVVRSHGRCEPSLEIDLEDELENERGSETRAPRWVARSPMWLVCALALALGLTVGVKLGATPRPTLSEPETKAIASLVEAPATQPIAESTLAAPLQVATPSPSARGEADAPRRAGVGRVRRAPYSEGQTVADEEAGTAQLYVSTTNGWADVYLGAHKLGTTPKRFELPAGVQVVRVLPRGVEPALEYRVSLRAGETQRMKVVLP